MTDIVRNGWPNCLVKRLKIICCNKANSQEKIIKLVRVVDKQKYIHKYHLFSFIYFILMK